MSKTELIKRYFVFLIAVSLGGIGVSLFTKGAIGVTPISSLNYVLSLHCPLSLGGTTFVFNMVLIVMQYLMFPKAERRSQIGMLLAQIPVTFIFSGTIDLSMAALDQWVPPTWNTYAWSLFWVIAGSVTLALGISLQVLANVAMVSGEAVVKQISSKFKFEFGYVKLGFDITLVVLAIISSLAFTQFSELEGVREGTIVGALLVGPLVRVIRPRLGFINLFFYSEQKRQTFKAQQIEEAQSFQGCISIAREAGLGSHIIGKALAQRMHVKLYDSSLIDIIALEAGIDRSEVEKKAEHLESSFIQDIIFADLSVPLTKSASHQDELFVATARVMRKLARQESCVFIGYNGDFILKDNPRNLRVFLYASEDFKCNYCKEELKLEREDALAHMQDTDRKHQEHHLYYTGKQFRDPSCYDLCLDVSVLGRDECVEMIFKAYELLQQHPRANYIHKSYTIGHGEDVLLNKAANEATALDNENKGDNGEPAAATAAAAADSPAADLPAADSPAVAAAAAAAESDSASAAK